LAIDFQMSFMGPVSSDLAYLLTSGTVQPDVYENHLDEILEEFYRQFVAKSSKYRDLTYKQMREEFTLMAHVLFARYIVLGCQIWKAAWYDNDAGLAAGVAEGGLGSGVISYEDLPASEKRKRLWWIHTINNFVAVFKALDTPSLLSSLSQEDIDFNAAFDISHPRGCPWPQGGDGRYVDVSLDVAMELSQGGLSKERAVEIAVNGTISFNAFNEVVIPGWSVIGALEKTKAV
jgi:hypothetical protein